MKIAVLGWGSLIWDQRDLKLNDVWKNNGPLLPVEFARISNDGRLTLVLREGSKSINVLWNLMNLDSLEEARENLKEREGVPNIARIGFVNLINNTSQSRYDHVTSVIVEWAEKNSIDAVIWTDLGVKFKDSINLDFNHMNVISYLENLPSEKKTNAKKYIVNAPEQIATELRGHIQEKMNWRKENEQQERKHAINFKSLIRKFLDMLNL